LAEQVKATNFAENFDSRMFKIIAVMFVGIAIGYLLRRWQGVKYVGTTTMATIVALLFVMGGEIGGNEAVMRNLPRLGGDAVLIALATVAGSVVAARAVYNIVKGGGRRAE
jgi:uncharacterized membrane protein YbjE (DUF340 family)